MSTPDPTEYETLKELVAAGREREGNALVVEGRPAPYSYHDLCTNVWKAGNLFTHYGIHADGTLGVVVGSKSAEFDAEDSFGSSEPLLAVLGGGLVGGLVDVSPVEPVDSAVLVAPAHRDIESTRGCTRLAYGGPPTDPDVSHFERDLWSENPIEPPESVAGDREFLQVDGDTWTQSAILSVARAVIETHGMADTTRVVLDAPLTEPGAFVAGVLAPLSVGATIVVPEIQGGVDSLASDQDTSPEDRTLVVSDDQGGTHSVDPAVVTDWLHETRRV